jgi:intein-encoded DNA endonuclease-like protein
MKVKDELKRRFSNIESVPLFALATLVHPRFKKVAFTSVMSCNQGQSRLISEMSPSAPSTPSQPPQETPESGVDYNTELWKKFDDRSQLLMFTEVQALKPP